MNNFIQGIGYVFCNEIVASIHFWKIRKFFYKKMGMQIGENSRILRKTIIVSPRNIVIGDNVYINEYCYLDGRGGISIGDNTSISVYSYINTGYHDINDSDFAYVKKPVIIENNVFIGSHGIVLAGAKLSAGNVVCAGSVMKSGIYPTNGIYSGIPAVRVGERKGDAVHYNLGEWRPWFR